MFVLFFFKQKTADELRISDWSSDVCSSDLSNRLPPRYASAATWCPRTRVRKAAEPFGGTTAGRLRSACLGAFRLDFFRFGATQLGADQALHHAQLAIAELQRGVDPDLGDPHQLDRKSTRLKSSH